MAPDADKLRNRRGQQHEQILDDSVDASEPTITVNSIKSLGPNEIVIDGAVYDISNFDHPGGESIHVFGGNDCTVQYKMIHPYHTTKHLEKMTRIGTIPNYTSE